MRFHAARQRQHFRLRFLEVQVPLLPFRLCLRAVPFAEAAAKAMISNDFDKFVDYVYVKEGTSEEEEKQGKEQLSAMLKAKTGNEDQKYTDCKVLNCELNDGGDRAKVEVEFTLKDGSTKTDKMPVRKGKDGKWGVVLY